MFRKEPLEFLRQVLFVVFVYEVFRCGFKKSVANTVQFIKKSLRILFVREKDHPHSHSIVAGGLLVMSYATRFTPGTSATMRPDTRASTS